MQTQDSVDENKQVIIDTQGKSYQLSVSDEGEKVEGLLTDNKCHIGIIDGFYSSTKEFLLARIEIFEPPICPQHFLIRAIHKLLKLKPPNYRGLGLGTALLEQFLFPYMRAKGVTCISGAANPMGGLDYNQLTAWYQRRGFTISPARVGDVGSAHLERLL